MKFIFRNNTIEFFLGKDYICSGYDDISVIPEDADSYLWWYQLPIKYNQEQLAEEVLSYTDKIRYVLEDINPVKQIVALTMDILYNVKFTDDDRKVKDAVKKYNDALYSLARDNNNLRVIDINDFTRRYPADNLIDWKFYFISQMGMNPKLALPFKKWLGHKMDSIALKRKKCLVLDLDNTLWGGVLGEDGIEGIKIGGDYPGKAFLYFQEALKELSKNGVILTICSKNNEEDVLEAWKKNPFMVLRKEDFAAYRINWNDKANNIKELSTELNIGLDSMVFVDDNPAERELIRNELPMVEVPEFPKQPYELPLFLSHLVESYFKVYSLTEEDKKKTEQYKANAMRNQVRKTFTDMDSFLKSLDMQLTIEAANDFNIPRIAQMTQKTNQFNLTTHRYTEADVRGLISQGWKIWCISVADKFGDNGITGCVMIDDQGNIDTFLLSCRILGRGIETAFLKAICKAMKQQNFKTIHAKYIPTAKNKQVETFFENNGFTLDGCSEKGEKSYHANMDEFDVNIKPYYNIKFK